MAKIIKSLTALKPNGEVETLAVPWLERGGGEIVERGDNWYRLGNGIQVCRGYVTIPALNALTSTASDVTFDMPFIDVPIMSLVKYVGAYWSWVEVGITAFTPTAVSIVAFNNNYTDASQSVVTQYHAIGFWK